MLCRLSSNGKFLLFSNTFVVMPRDISMLVRKIADHELHIQVHMTNGFFSDLRGLKDSLEICIGLDSQFKLLLNSQIIYIMRTLKLHFYLWSVCSRCKISRSIAAKPYQQSHPKNLRRLWKNLA